MRILQIIQKRQLRGAEIFASQLSEQLMENGHDVLLVSLFDGAAELPFSGRQVCIHANPANRFSDFSGWKKLNDIIVDFRPDIVQANAGDTLKYAVCSKLIFRWRGKLIFRNANLMSAFMRGRLHRAFKRWLLNYCDFFISVSDNCRADLIRFYNGAIDRIVTVPIGVASFDDIKGISRSSGDAPVMIAIGSLVPEKNHLFLLEVFRTFCMSNAKGTLWIVGDGKLRVRLEEKAVEFGIDDRIKFWGYRANVIEILKSADVFIMPSLIEGLPAVILEAIACDVPVIASAVGGIPEVIENETTGICLDRWSVDEYVSGIIRILDDVSFRNRILNNSKLRLKEKFTLPKVVRDFENTYSRLLGNGLR